MNHFGAHLARCTIIPLIYFPTQFQSRIRFSEVHIFSLVTNIKALDIGIDIESEKNCILLYADDIVLIAENENDLQLLIDILNTWCKHKALNVSFEKTKIVHFRNPSVPPTNEIFLMGEKTVRCCIKISISWFIIN